MPAPTKTPRLTGVDAARGLAVLGMIIAHVAANAEGAIVDLVDGRSSILFATLAGVSLSLLTGGRAIHAALGGDRRRLAVRAAVLFVLGLLLEEISTGPLVILAYYAVMFLVALPFLRVRPAILLAVALAWAVAGPLVSYGLRSLSPVADSIERLTFSDLRSLPDLGATLLVTGTYPVLTWMPFVLAGMAIGRMDLRSTAIRLRLLAGGAAAAVVGYGGSWLALATLGGPGAMLRRLDDLFGVVPTLTPAFLLVDTPHSGTPFEIIGSGGVAVAVLATCLLVSGLARGRLLWPLTGVGALALTVYAGHIGVLALLPRGVPWQMADPWPLTIAFCLCAIGFAALWRHTVGRGPLEYVIHTASVRAAGGHVRLP